MPTLLTVMPCLSCIFKLNCHYYDNKENNAYQRQCVTEDIVIKTANKFVVSLDLYSTVTSLQCQKDFTEHVDLYLLFKM